MDQVKVGSSGVILGVFLQDSSSSTGDGLTGLAHDTSGLTCYYKRSDGNAHVQVNLATITTLGQWESGGFKEVSSSRMPGFYEFHPPNAAFAVPMPGSVTWVTFFFRGAENLLHTPVKVRITKTDDQDDEDGGLTNLDAAVSTRLATADYAPDDPLDNPVPGSYATGTAGYALGRLGSGQVTTVSPVAQSGDVEVVVGDTYTDNLGRALEWTDASAAWPDLTDATIKMEVGDGTLVKTGSVVIATGSSKQVRVELLGSDTDDLVAGVYDFQVVAEFPGTGVSAGETDRVTLVQGKMTVIDSEAS